MELKEVISLLRDLNCSLIYQMDKIAVQTAISYLETLQKVQGMGVVKRKELLTSGKSIGDKLIDDYSDFREGEKMKYRKKPIVIDAIQWTGVNWEEIGRFVGNAASLAKENGKNILLIDTLESGKNKFQATEGDFIIKGIKGEFYACKPDIFKATYESADIESKDDIFIRHIQTHLQEGQAVICKICGKSVESIVK